MTYLEDDIVFRLEGSKSKVRVKHENPCVTNDTGTVLHSAPSGPFHVEIGERPLVA